MPWATLLALGLLTLLPGLSTLPIVDRDEPRFAHATMEMIDRGEWVVPYFNDAYRFDKPPLTYWWMRLHYAVLGENEFAARLHSVLAAWACAAVLFLWGRQLFDRSVGWWAAVGWLTCLQVLIHGRIALADMPMILAVLVSQWSLWNILAGQATGRRWWWALWVGLALGFLAKGPIVIFVPLLAWLLFAAVGRLGHPWPLRRLGAWRGLGLVLLLVGAWGIPALLLTNGAFFQQGVGEHVVKRGFEPFNNRSWNPLYYLVVFVFLFPFSGWLPQALRRAWRDPRLGRFLVAWFASPIVIFTFYQTQLPHYILPGYGGALLLIFGYNDRASLRASWFSWVLSGVMLLIAGAALFLGLLGDPPAGMESFQVALFALGVSVLALIGIQQATRVQRPVWLLLAVLVLAGGFSILGRSLREASLSVRLGTQLEGAALSHPVGIGYSEPSLVYYTDHAWTFPPREEWGGQAARLGATDASVFVFKRRRWKDEEWLALYRGASVERPIDAAREAFPDEPPPGWRAEIVSGLVTGNFSWIEVEVWRRGP